MQFDFPYLSMEGRAVSCEDPKSIADFLESCSLFRGCDKTVIARVVPHCERVELTAGQSLFRAGGPAEGITVICSGRAMVQMVNAVTGATVQVETLQVGDHTGEVAALLKSAQPYAVVADGQCTVLRVRAELVDTLCSRVPVFALALARRLAARSVALGLAALRTPPMGASAGATGTTGVGGGVSPLRGPTGTVPRPGERPRSVTPAQSEGLRFVEVSDYLPDAQTVAMLPAKTMLLHRVIALSLDGSKLTVGMVSPRSAQAIAELRRVLPNVTVETVAISADDFSQSVVTYRIEAPVRTDGTRDPRAVSADTIVYDGADAERESDKTVRVVGDEVVRAVNRIIAAGLSLEASDIHIEPEPAGLRVRFRVQGLLHDWAESLPPSFSRGVIARLKVLAGLDITERRLPQDGRIGMTAGSREVDLRVSTLPASRGEKAVLRVFEGSGMMRPLEEIFIDPQVAAVAKRVLDRPHGGVIVSGGTGSGKSSTLYGMLHQRRRARPDSNILLVEDPIEYRLPGVTQVQVDPSIGLGFAEVLRASLRQDPDVIALGETRDAATAQVALEAAMTGHLLLTSMHASDVASTLQRIESLGCSRTLISQSLSFIVAQKLVRRLCRECLKVEAPPAAVIESLAARKLVERGAALALPRAVGCELCQGTGYRGRVLVIESLLLDETSREGLLTGQTISDVLRIAQRARTWQPFHLSAALLMARKLISPSEALLAMAE